MLLLIRGAVWWGDFETRSNPVYTRTVIIYLRANLFTQPQKCDGPKGEDESINCFQYVPLVSCPAGVPQSSGKTNRCCGYLHTHFGYEVKTGEERNFVIFKDKSKCIAEKILPRALY